MAVRVIFIKRGLLPWNNMFDFKLVQKDAQDYWDKIDLPSKLLKKNEKGKKYFFLDGPPYANNDPHVGHIRNTVYKDLFIRLNFMKGYDVFFQPGFDTHGLPVENVVEKKLGLKSKKDIYKMGASKFTDECKKTAILNKDVWFDVYGSAGCVYAWKADNPYLTFDNSYLQSAWWAFKKCWDRDLVYEGKKPVFWCPKCETALSGYEVTDSYAMLSDPSILVKFKIRGKDEHLLVFTTTPWTLISNTAIAAKPDADYVKVDTLNGTLILAKERLELLTELEMGFTILEEFKGEKLKGVHYEPLLDVPQQRELAKNDKAHKVYMSIPILKERVASKIALKKEGGKTSDVFEDFVSTDSGTGLVHTVPGAGKTDNEFGKTYGLPEISPLDSECKFTDMAGEYEGRFVKDADKDILARLDGEDKLLHSTMAEHKYPVCWRCKAPLIYKLSDQLFMKIEPLRERLLEFNKHDVGWFPEFARERFLSWVANAEDWNFSRQRFWGIPIPLWKCDCGERKIISNVDELRENSTEGVPDGFDLHRASEIKLKCVCGKEMERTPDIFDVWYDSGVAPFASLGYPYTNKELFEERSPVNWINEAQDQIRGWFYSLAVMSAAVFDKPAYQNVSMTGWVLDAKGDKMSKSVGNVVWAKDAVEKHGADPVRLYYLMDVAPYSTQKFNEETLTKEVTKVISTLLNVSRYITGSKFNALSLVDMKVEDRWLLSKLNTLIKFVRENLENYNLHLVGREIANFILNDLSRGYIQYIRDRLNEESVVTAVIAECLYKVSLLMAPITPFVSERVFLRLKEKFGYDLESVHLGAYPESEAGLIDGDLEKKFIVAKGVIEGILAAREEVGLGIRWPLKGAKVSLYVDEDVSEIEEVIKRQCNVKSLSFDRIEKGIESEVRVGTFNEGYVVVDSQMTPELELEGFTREVVRRIQMQRKKAGCKKDDKVKVFVEGEFDVSSGVNDISNKTGSEVEFGKTTEFDSASEFKIKGKSFAIWLKKKF